MEILPESKCMGCGLTTEVVHFERRDEDLQVDVTICEPCLRLRLLTGRREMWKLREEKLARYWKEWRKQNGLSDE